MVGLNAYATITFNHLHPGQGIVLPSSYNVASAVQDQGNINAGLLRVNFTASFVHPPIINVQPVRLGLEWLAPEGPPPPFAPNGPNIQREVFPMPPAQVLGDEVDEIFDIPGPRVYQPDPPVPPPEPGREMPTSARIELEQKMLSYRLMFVERDHFVVQFGSYIGKIVELRPHKLDGGAGDDGPQRVIIREIMFNFMACGDIASGS